MSQVRFFETIEKRRDKENNLVDTTVLRFERDLGLTKTERDATEDDKKVYALEFKQFESTIKKPNLIKGK